VQRFKHSTALALMITLTIMSISTVTRSQSGRTRPRVPTTGTPAQPAPPVNVPGATAAIKQEQAGTTSRFVLQNGMTVIINEQHAAPIVALVASFKAGARDESDMMTGAARLLQRMIEQSPSLADLRAIGGTFDADVSDDRATYSILVAPDKLKEAIGVQAAMLQTPALDAEAMRREVPLIIAEEKYRAGLMRDNALAMSDESSAFAMARLLDLAFARQPAVSAQPASAESLRTITRDQLMGFYRAHYRPDKLTITVAGDISTFSTLIEIQQRYGSFGAGAGEASQPTRPQLVKPSNKGQTPGASPRPPVQPERANADKPQSDNTPRLRYGADRGDINQTIVSIGFRAPGVDLKERMALEVLAATLGQGRASRLNRALLDGQMLVTRVDAGYLPVASDSLLTVQMRIATDAQNESLIDKAESALFRELDDVRRELPTEGEMARAKTLLEKRYVERNATYASRARSLAQLEPLRGTLREALDYRARIHAVRAEDVQRVAAKYLSLTNTAVHEYEPLTAAPRTFDSARFAETVIAWAPGFATTAENVKARAVDPNSTIAPVAQGQEHTADQLMFAESIQPLPMKDYSTLNGPRAFVREDHSQPKVTVALLFQGGQLVEDETTSGTTELMLGTLLYGTPRRTGTQLTQEWDQLGADVEIVIEPDFCGFVLSVLSRNADRALKLLRDSVEEPAFRDDDVKRALLAQIGRIRNARDASRARADELLHRAMWPGHAYGLPAHGREEVITKLTADQLREWHTRAIKHQLPLAFIVGDTNGSALVSSQLAEGFRRRDLDKSLPVKVPQPKAAEQSESRRREQTTLALGLLGPKGDSADLLALELIEAVMNGRGGRLLQALRDQQGVAMKASLRNEALFAAGTIAAHIITTPDNEARARAALLGEFERLAREGLSAADLTSAQAVAATWRLAALQSQTTRVLMTAHTVVYQREAADVDGLVEQLAKVTASDVKRVAAAYLKTATVAAGIVRGTPPPQPATTPSAQKPD
jgi:zinc protease